SRPSAPARSSTACSARSRPSGPEPESPLACWLRCAHDGHMSETAGTETITTDCVVVGGGPAGLMLGLLLARRGVRATVLEQHGDFLRDFRGDTIHPSTQQNLHEL